MRDFIKDNISIDGRNIEYRLVTVSDYLKAKDNLNPSQIDDFIDNHNKEYTLINQIMAIKQSCYLLRRVSHSCGSLAEDLYDLKLKLIRKLKTNYNYDFDDNFVEMYGFTDKELLDKGFSKEDIKKGVK